MNRGSLAAFLTAGSLVALPVAAAQATTTVRITGPVETHADSGPLGGWLPLVTAGVAVIGVFLVILQLRGSRRAARDERTAALAARYQTRAFQDVASRTLSFFRVEDAVECVRKLEAFERRAHAGDACLPRARDRPDGPKASVNDLFEVLGYFEDLAAAYNRNELTRRKLHDTLPRPPVQFFTAGWWYICWERGGGWVGREPWKRIPARLLRPRQTDVWIQFEWMVKALRKRVRSVAQRDTPAENGLILCLPPESERNADAEWPRARQVSQLLSSYRGSLKALVDHMEKKAFPDQSPKGRSEPEWEVVIVPPSIDECKPQSQERQWLTERLQPCVTRLDATVISGLLKSLK